MPSWDWTPTEPPPCLKRSQVSAPRCERSHSPTLGWAAPGSSRPPLLSSEARCTEAGEGQRLDWAVPGRGATVPPLTTATGSDSEAGVAGERLTPDTPGKAPTPGEGTADGLPGSRQLPGAWGSGGQMRPQGVRSPPRQPGVGEHAASHAHADALFWSPARCSRCPGPLHTHVCTCMQRRHRMHTRACTRLHTNHMHACTCKHMCTCVCTHLHSRMYGRVCARLRSYVHEHMCVLTCTRHTHTHAHGHRKAP